MLEKIWNQKMGGQGQHSDSADGNKILIITIQAAKYWVFIKSRKPNILRPEL